MSELLKDEDDDGVADVYQEVEKLRRQLSEATNGNASNQQHTQHIKSLEKEVRELQRENSEMAELLRDESAEWQATRRAEVKEDYMLCWRGIDKGLRWGMEDQSAAARLLEEVEEAVSQARRGSPGFGAPDLEALQALFEQSKEANGFTDEQLYQLFDALDADRDGYVQVAELRENFTSVASRFKFADELSLSQLESLFLYFDVDGSKSLDFGEFSSLVRSCPSTP